MSWVILFALLLSIGVNGSAEDSLHHVKRLPTVVVVGTVYCDTCFQQEFSSNSHFISGASVAVECKGGADEYTFREEVKTNKHGEFEVRLPFSVAKHVRKIERCSVDLMSSNEPHCSVASRATSPTLHLQSRKQGDHIFSAGFFTFKPSKQPNSCHENPNLSSQKSVMNHPSSYLDTMFPPIQDLPSPPSGLLPPIPLLPPLPKLPPLRLPALPGLRLPMPPLTGSASP